MAREDVSVNLRHDEDVCECGDARRQHVDGTGRCKLSDLCTPGHCRRFRLFRRACEDEPPPAAPARQPYIPPYRFYVGQVAQVGSDKWRTVAIPRDLEPAAAADAFTACKEGWRWRTLEIIERVIGSGAHGERPIR